MIRKKTSIMQKKEAAAGRLFVLPFYIGFLLFFARPIFETLILAFSSATIEFGGYDIKLTGLENLKYVFTKDLDFTNNLLQSVGDLLWQLPIVVFLSLFIAIIINTKFPMRTFVRAVFFLPVIVVTGTIVLILQSDSVASAALEGNIVAGGQIVTTSGLDDVFIQVGLNSSLVKFLTTLTESMFNLVWRTGVQMIIFLAGLQSIPSSLYEASAIEGATPWENFFKITLPMLVPIIQLNMVYTIVDSFTDSNNSAMNQVMVNISAFRMGTASAMAWSYFLLAGLIIAGVMLLFSKITKKYC